MNFWARASSVLLLLPAALASAQSYGRFGGEGLPQPVGFSLSPEGFRVVDSPGDTFRFLTPLADIVRTERSDRHSVAAVRPVEGVPTALRVSLRSPGFEFQIKGRVVLRLGSLQRPVLTVAGASYDGVPTPVSTWMLVSFRESQPPVLLSVPEGAGLDWEITGQTGAWTLTNRTDYEGWVRVSAPMGRVNLKSDEGLARFASVISTDQVMWSQATSKLVSSSVTETETGLQAIWNFDRLYSLIPPALLLSRTGASGVEIVSGIQVSEADFAEGPQGFSLEPRWVFRFPLRRLPPGRALVRGELAKDAPFDRHMLALLTSAGDPGFGKAQAIGDGTENLVRHGRSAFAEMAMSRWGWKPKPVEVTSVQKLLWSRDFSSMTLFGASPGESAEAAGWLALALGPHEEAAMRLEGCLLWSGITSQRVLAEYRRKRGLDAIELKKEVPLAGVLASLYGQQMMEPSMDWEMLNSPVRILTGQRVVASIDTIEWKPVPGEGPLKIVAPLDAGWVGVDGTQMTAEWSGSEWTLRASPGPSGKCRIKGKLPLLPGLR